MSDDKVDDGCICRGNWRLLVSKYEPLIGRHFKDSKGKAYQFFGLVHTEEDYYYGMMRRGRITLLSCVGDFDSWEMELISHE